MGAPAIDDYTLHALVTAIVSQAIYSGIVTESRDKERAELSARRATLLINASREAMREAPPEPLRA